MEKLKFTTVEVFDKLMMILTTDTPYILTPDGPEINIQWCQHFGSHDLTFADSAISTVPVPSVVSASSSVVFSVSSASSVVPASSVVHVASAASASSVASAVSVTSVASATSASSASSASSATSSDVSAFPSSTVASDASSVASVSASDEDDWSDEEDISVPIKRTPWYEITTQFSIPASHIPPPATKKECAEMIAQICKFEQEANRHCSVGRGLNKLLRSETYKRVDGLYGAIRQASQWARDLNHAINNDCPEDLSPIARTLSVLVANTKWRLNYVLHILCMHKCLADQSPTCSQSSSKPESTTEQVVDWSSEYIPRKRGMNVKNEAEEKALRQRHLENMVKKMRNRNRVVHGGDSATACGESVQQMVIAFALIPSPDSGSNSVETPPFPNQFSRPSKGCIKKRGSQVTGAVTKKTVHFADNTMCDPPKPESGGIRSPLYSYRESQKLRNPLPHTTSSSTQCVNASADDRRIDLSDFWYAHTGISGKFDEIETEED